MKVKVRLFALYREAVGGGELEMEVEGATVGHLLQALRQRFPRLNPHSPVVAVNGEYAGPEATIKEGDEVALLPPFSGGEVRVTPEPLDAPAIAGALVRDVHGALVTFQGVVRGRDGPRRVLHLEYEAYPEMAERKLKEIVAEVRARWPVADVALHHRVGRVGVGEASLVVAVAAPHRREAFAACRYAVDRIKEIAPIWKKEVFPDGEAWVGPQG